MHLTWNTVSHAPFATVDFEIGCGELAFQFAITLDQIV